MTNQHQPAPLRMFLAGALVALGCACQSSEGSATQAVGALRPAGGEFEFTDSAAWQVGDSGTLDLIDRANYEPPHRSPTALALLKSPTLGSFELSLEAQSTGREYGHRDLCLVFGYQDPSHYYYVHLAPAPDAHAHNVFLVDGAPRRALLPVQETSMNWDDEWHSLRLVRELDTGTVAVYVDGATEPILTAIDGTFGEGRIGFGSFDDTGRFRNVTVRAL